MAGDLAADRALAVAIAQEAGALLLKLRAAGAGGAEGDAQANLLILDRLRTERPHDGILSEETIDDASRCAIERAWIVDPLDGTREFAEGRDDWAVHIGLSVGGAAAVGAVAMPTLGRVFDGSEPVPPCEGALRILVSRSRAPDVAVRVAGALDAELVPMGSAGAKAMAVLRGEAHAYLHAGGQHQWDNCAPVAVALAAGLHASRIDGSAIVYNLEDTLVPDLLICRPEVAGAILGAVRSSA